MSEIKRYEPYAFETLHWVPQCDADMREAPDGDWMLHEDHLAAVSALEAENARLVKDAAAGWEHFHKLRKAVGEDRYPDMTGEVKALAEQPK